MKKRILIIGSLLLLIAVLLFVGLGFLSSYIGYYGYQKHLRRRISATRQESQERETFIEDLDYSLDVDSVEIKHVFLEKGFLWGGQF